MTTEKKATSSSAVTSMITGILGLIILGPLGSIPAIICGHIGLSATKNPPGLKSGRGMAVAGLIMGYLGLAVFVLIIPALLIPAVSSALNKGQQAQARNNMRQIEMAVTSYYTEYSELPPFRDMGELAAQLGGNNPRNIKFLEVSPDYFRDRWGSPYQIVADQDYDGTIQVGNWTANGLVALWSIGPNRVDEKGAGDDIRSR